MGSLPKYKQYDEISDGWQIYIVSLHCIVYVSYRPPLQIVIKLPAVSYYQALFQMYIIWENTLVGHIFTFCSNPSNMLVLAFFVDSVIKMWPL